MASEKIEIELTPEEMEELLRDMPRILGELNEDVVREELE